MFNDQLELEWKHVVAVFQKGKDEAAQVPSNVGNLFGRD